MKEHNLMDYSMLVAIENTPEDSSHSTVSLNETFTDRFTSMKNSRDLLTDSIFQLIKEVKQGQKRNNKNHERSDLKLNYDESCSDAHKTLCVNQKLIAHLAIIDYLQLWNVSKQLERFVKVYALNKDGVGLSAVEP